MKAISRAVAMVLIFLGLSIFSISFLYSEETWFQICEAHCGGISCQLWSSDPHGSGSCYCDGSVPVCSLDR